MIGKVFGKWTVVEEKQQTKEEKKKNNYHHLYICKCECGTIKLIQAGTLRHGKSRQCRECSKKTTDTELYIGKMFGKWTVISESQKTEVQKSKKKYRCSFICKCECGYIGTVSPYNLRNGISKRCMKCSKRPADSDSYAGKIHGKWTVISLADKGSRKAKGLHYNCQCECGTKQIINGGSLRNGATTKCRDCLKINTSGWIGKKFGQWTVLADTDPVNTYKSFLCECKCGTKRAIPAHYLKRGDTKSCHKCAVTTHGKKGKRIYNIWRGIKARCNNPNEPAFNNYGGRGIKVCDRWLTSFENFFEDMGDCPKGLQIDRIDNNGHYEPSNCKFVTPKENCNNRRVSPKNRIPQAQLSIASPD